MAYILVIILGKLCSQPMRSVAFAGLKVVALNGNATSACRTSESYAVKMYASAIKALTHLYTADGALWRVLI